MKSLWDSVALVTGASRGIGKGIALALAAEGATVYVTGRAVEPGSHDLPGSIGETARACTRRGGTGIAVQVDHANDEQVAALFERIARVHGKLDILVNNAFSLPEDLTEPQPFWKKRLFVALLRLIHVLAILVALLILVTGITNKIEFTHPAGVKRHARMHARSRRPGCVPCRGLLFKTYRRDPSFTCSWRTAHANTNRDLLFDVRAGMWRRGEQQPRRRARDARRRNVSSGWGPPGVAAEGVVERAA